MPDDFLKSNQNLAIYQFCFFLKGFGGLGQRIRSRSRRRHSEQRQSNWSRCAKESGKTILSEKLGTRSFVIYNPWSFLFHIYRWNTSNNIANNFFLIYRRRSLQNWSYWSIFLYWVTKFEIKKFRVTRYILYLFEIDNPPFYQKKNISKQF